MSDNPYASPAAMSDEPPLMQPRGPRPVGVSILAILALIGGVILLVTQFALLDDLNQHPLAAIGLSPVLLVIGVLFLGVAAGRDDKLIARRSSRR